MNPDELREFVGKDVVVDTDSSIFYVGRLEDVKQQHLVFSKVDVHDTAGLPITTTKEIYVMESCKYGVRANRKSVHVRLARVVSISPLDDIVQF